MNSPSENETRWPASTAAIAGVVFSVVFAAATWLLAPRLAVFAHLPDQGAGWYFWKLAEPTWVTRTVVWSLYAVHQVSMFALIAWAQRHPLRYSTQLHKVNVWALALNGVMALLHLLQTHITYDGLAQDVHLISPLAAVAVLLIWVLLLEVPRRGLAFGYRPPFPRSLIDAARAWHGYFFSWAIIYTFWFHPTEATSGHLWGFFYTLVLMLQGSLFFTRLHVNRWWTLLLEVLVLVHGTAVAVDQGNRLWPMFFFGFSAIFVITQMHGLGLSRRTRVGLALIWLAAIGWVYREQPSRALGEVLRIPIVDYVSVGVLCLLLGLLVAVLGAPKRPRRSP